MFVFEVLKGGGTQWTVRKRKPPDLLGFVKDVYRPSVSNCVAYISKISSRGFFLLQTLLSPGSSGCFVPLFEETPGTGVELLCLSAKANRSSAWKPCF